MRASSCATGRLVLLILSCGASQPGSTASNGGAGGAEAGGTSGGGSASGVQASGSGGGGNSSGTASGGDTSGGKASGGAPMMPPVKVSNCDGLAAAGVFEEITPADVKAGIGVKTPDNQTQGGPWKLVPTPDRSSADW